MFFIGMYNVTVDPIDGLRLPAFFAKKLDVGDKYSILIDREKFKSGDQTLIYRFKKNILDGEELLATLEVKEGKMLVVPKEYKNIFCGKCVVTGVMDSLELQTDEAYKQKEHEVSAEEILDMIKELGLED